MARKSAKNSLVWKSRITPEQFDYLLLFWCSGFPDTKVFDGYNPSVIRGNYPAGKNEELKISRRAVRNYCYDLGIYSWNVFGVQLLLDMLAMRENLAPGSLLYSPETKALIIELMDIFYEKIVDTNRFNFRRTQGLRYDSMKHLGIFEMLPFETILRESFVKRNGFSRARFYGEFARAYIEIICGYQKDSEIMKFRKLPISDKEIWGKMAATIVDSLQRHPLRRALPYNAFPWGMDFNPMSSESNLYKNHVKHDSSSS